LSESKEITRASYDRLSPWYDLIGGWAEIKHMLVGLQMLQAREGERVLEIGPGTGHGLLALRRSLGSSGVAYGIDLSGGMLGSARAKIRQSGLVGRVELVQGDGAWLPFGVGCFEAVFMSFTLELFTSSEIPEVLGECRRVLRRGGRICVVALSEKDGWVVRLYKAAHEKLPNVVDCRPIAVRQLIESAGFRVLEAREMSLWGLPVETVLAIR
jgi:demethylmenaquinone methyltransferase/2-methoxy-6-polyprenyl-1,4-benzoquinol methylase